jgi:hypothetical protein
MAEVSLRNIQDFPVVILRPSVGEFLINFVDIFRLTLGQNCLENSEKSINSPKNIKLFSVTACYREPHPGWVDNLLGPTALVATHGKGIVHTFLCRPEIPIDHMPADMVKSPSEHKMIFFFYIFQKFLRLSTQS